MYSEETDSEVDKLDWADWAYGDRWNGYRLIGTDYRQTIIVGGEQSTMKAPAERDAPCGYYYYRDCYLRFPLEYLRLAANGTASSEKHYREEDENPD